MHRKRTSIDFNVSDERFISRSFAFLIIFNCTFAQKITVETDHLRIHCYRAMLELLLARHFPAFRRSDLSKVRHFERLNFGEYVLQATRRLPIQIDAKVLADPVVTGKERDHMQVVAFYILRVLMAPVLETFVQLDRQLHLWTVDRVQSALIPLFDPRLSPRNSILIAQKDT